MNLSGLLRKGNTFIRNNTHYYKFKDRLHLSKKTYDRLVKFDMGYKSACACIFNNHTINFTSPFWFLHSVNEIFVEEVYKFFSKKKEPVIIDCGANIGLSVLYFKKLNENSRIIAFEADPSVFKQLEKNIGQYNYKNIELMNAAVWNSERKIIFNSEGSVGGKISLDERADNTVEIPAIRLRDYLSTEIDFLKIDIEGAEYEVLKDCAAKLINVKNLFIEYHVMPDEEQRLPDILNWAKAAGFKYYIREAWNNMTHPYLKSYNHFYQMQLNIFCYRPCEVGQEKSLLESAI